MQRNFHLLIGTLLLANLFVSAQQRAAHRLAPVRGPVQLIRHADVIPEDVSAFPRVVAGPGLSPEIAAAINASLSHAEARVRSQALECDAVGRKMHYGSKVWTRKVDVTMRGPRFLTYLATDDYYCGAYPNFDMQSSLVFDLTTGEQVDWAKFLPAGSDAADWPALSKIAKARASAECKDVFDEDKTISFALSLNARTGTLDARPNNFSHVMQACAETVALDTTTLRSLGVAQPLIGALNAAHALQQ